MMHYLALYLAGLAGFIAGTFAHGWLRDAKLADTHMRGWVAGWSARAAFEHSTERMIAEAELRNAGFTRECKED